ncbi:MAG: NAD-dependent epimerase/dehydratase family protein, partial [Desulfobacteraceae bacterium]
ITRRAKEYGARIRDVRKTPPRKDLHFFTGKIEEVTSLRVALLGTDSAIGKRTTAWVVIDDLRGKGYSAELVGTGQTAWMQGARYSIILDSLINDFVSGEIEHAIWSAWNEERPDVIVVEGQGSLMNPAYPGGFEILAAGRPDVVILQHAPARKEYDGFPGYPLHPLEKQIQAIELLFEKPVVAITINHEDLDKESITSICEEITKQTGLPACDVLLTGAEPAFDALRPYIKT